MAGRRTALIVVVDEYEHDGLRDLRAPTADASALSDVLGDPEIGDFDVRVVSNKPAHVIAEEIEEFFAASRSDDSLLLHFSCHGLKSEAGELFFAACNTRPNRLRSTAVAADFVQRCMELSRSHSVVLLLDCCYGGAFGRGVRVRAAGDVNVLDSFPRGNLGGGRGRAVITACSAVEYAFDGDQLTSTGAGTGLTGGQSNGGERSRRPSVFTSAVVDGLASGDADRDEDGLITLDELYDYVFDRVKRQNPHQTPSRDIEMQGEFVLARSRRSAIRPQPIPAPLRAAMTDQNMYARLGAIAELRWRLLGDDLPSAAGAYEALTEIAHTDIMYVADAAKAALDEAAPRATEPHLDFGRLAKDALAEAYAVHLLGPPLARAGVAKTAESRIRIAQTPDGLDVSIDTSRAGELRGEIVITGPTGTIVLPVRAEVSDTSADAAPTPPRPTATPSAPAPPRPAPESASAASPPPGSASSPPASPAPSSASAAPGSAASPPPASASADAGLPRFHAALTAATAAAGPGDAYAQLLIELIAAGERYYHVAIDRPQEFPDWEVCIDAWRLAVAETRSDETVMIMPGPPRPQEIVDTVRWLAAEITRQVGVPIPVDEFA